MPFKLINKPQEYYERDARDIKKQTSLEGFIAPLESYGPPVTEEKKPFVPVKMVQPTYRLEEELKKRGYTKERNKNLWRYGPPRGEFAELIPWEGEAFVKRKGESFARVWLAPFGELDPRGSPVTGKWSGYMYVLPERLKISAGVKDSQDQAVDALLESETRNWGVTKEAFRERQQKELEERQKTEFMAKYPTEESAHIHDVDLIYAELMKAERFKPTTVGANHTPGFVRPGPEGNQYAWVDRVQALPSLPPKYIAMWQPRPAITDQDFERGEFHDKYEDAWDDLLAMVRGTKMKTTEEQHQAGVVPTAALRISPPIKEAIGRLLGEYIQRDGHAGMIGTAHYTEAELKNFLERYDVEIWKESKQIGPWPGQKTAPMGSWKEKWRPFVKAHFQEWQRGRRSSELPPEIQARIKKELEDFEAKGKRTAEELVKAGFRVVARTSGAITVGRADNRPLLNEDLLDIDHIIGEHLNPSWDRHIPEPTTVIFSSEPLKKGPLDTKFENYLGTKLGHTLGPEEEKEHKERVEAARAGRLQGRK